VTAGRFKSIVYVCLLSNQASPGVPIATVTKIGCRRCPTATVQRIHFRTIGLMLFNRGHAKDVPLLGELFRRRILLTLCKSPKLPKNHFFEKSVPLMEKFQNFNLKRFTGTWIHVFLPSFTEVGKAEVTKRACGIHHKKVAVFLFVCGFWSIGADSMGAMGAIAPTAKTLWGDAPKSPPQEF